MFKVILECDTLSMWWAYIEGVTEKYGPYPTGLEAATEFFKRVGVSPIEWEEKK